MPSRDIETREDVERIVRAFYTRAFADKMIGWLFTDIARLDLEEHIPRTTAFWETILLGAQSYTGGAFAPHASLHRLARLRPGHFERWLVLWCQAVDEQFDGPRAALAKVHAMRVARAFSARLQALPSASDPTPGGGLAVTHHGPRSGGSAKRLQHTGLGAPGRQD